MKYYTVFRYLIIPVPDKNIIINKPIYESALLEGNDLNCASNVMPITNKDIVNYLQCESGNIKFIKECFDFVYSGIQLNENNSKVILTEKSSGDTIVVNLESYVHNEIMNYASDMIDLYNN